MHWQHSIQIIFSCAYFIYNLSQNRTVTAEIENLGQYDVTLSGNSNIDGYPNTFYNRTYTLGEEEIVFRVVNGKPAKLGEVPYQVSVMLATPCRPKCYYTSICGGSIISPTKVLSAAHCFVASKFSTCFYKGRMVRGEYKNKYIMAGHLYTTEQYSYNDTLGYGQWRRVIKGRYSRSYTPRFVFEHDIAVLYLNKPFKFNAHVSAIKCASLKKEYSGHCLSSGYGRLSSYTSSKILNTAWLPILSTKKCQKILDELRMNASAFVCTSGLVSSVHSGDSGGPFVCQNTGDPADDGKGVLVGVTCSIIITDDINIALFTRVTSYSNFINSRCTFLLSSFNVLILICLINFTVSLF